jgi:4-aminobutyrate aminotransferase
MIKEVAIVKIEIKTELPGPKAKDIIARNTKVRWPAERPVPFVAKQGSGLYQTDVDGNTFMDFVAGVAVLSTGTCHARVVKAIQDQAAQLIHVGPLYLSELQTQLADKIGHLAPGNRPKTVFFQNSGAEAVEAALKLARYKTERSAIVAFLNAFHGRTYGAMSVTTSKIVQRKKYAPLLNDIYFTHFPYCYRCPINLEYPGCDVACLNYIEDTLFKNLVPSEEVAAFIVEPIQGEAGYVVPPQEFHPRLKSLAEKYGILFIADEVQSGIGRTGRMFAIEHWNGVEPDIITFAKGIASGMPLGGIIADQKVLTWGKLAHSSTFGGNPISCKVALETLAIIEDEKLLENAQIVGALMMERLTATKAAHKIIGDVRGKGLMIGIEIVDNQKTKRAAASKRDAIVFEAYKNGLLIAGCGESVIRLCPPLIINKDEANNALNIIEGCISTIESQSS